MCGEAGIGKGTTYEYFKSKEEILAKAILYDMALSFHRLESAMRKKKGFREKFRTILDFIEEHCREEAIYASDAGDPGDGSDSSGGEGGDEPLYAGAGGVLRADTEFYPGGKRRRHF